MQARTGDSKKLQVPARLYRNVRRIANLWEVGSRKVRLRRGNVILTSRAYVTVFHTVLLIALVRYRERNSSSMRYPTRRCTAPRPCGFIHDDLPRFLACLLHAARNALLNATESHPRSNHAYLAQRNGSGSICPRVGDDIV